ncbi:MAG: site-specific DNA-methyltransferase [Candidatus Sericytochromatia bacterium]|nr:site-specific DNA-methyltransferase [Candidatus Sericytochromatia bacterium]
MKSSASGLLLHGDNRLGLARLARTHKGKVRLCYLDPPYNTRRAMEHYDDSRDHASWLAMMRELLEHVRPLMAPDGVVVSQTDRHESAYLKVLLDEMLGREAYVTTIAVRMSATSGYKLEHATRTLVKNTEFIHVHAANLNLNEAAYEPLEDLDPHYACLLTPDGSRFGRLIADPEVRLMLAGAGLPARNASLVTLYGTSIAFRSWVLEHAGRICRSHTAPAKAQAAFLEGRLLADEPGDSPVVVPFPQGGDNYLIRRTASAIDQLIPLALKVRPVEVPGDIDRLSLTNLLGDWWDGFHLDMGNIRLEGGVPFAKGKKPERLLRRLIRMFTRPGDTVLDPFAGSGTTAAVAHKMGRHWVAIESGPQALSHVVPRLESVVSGQDQTGISRAEGWQGGGRYAIEHLP